MLDESRWKSNDTWIQVKTKNPTILTKKVSSDHLKGLLKHTKRFHSLLALQFQLCKHPFNMFSKFAF